MSISSVVWMLLRYLPRAIFVLAMKVLTYPLALIICLPPFVLMREERATTGYPSQFPGMERAFLVGWLRNFQPFDDCLDALFYNERYKGMWLRRFTPADFHNRWWVRYLFYVGWLWRNAAYGWARAVGFEQTGMIYIVNRNENAKWRKASNLSLRVVRNAAGQFAFLFECQWFFYRGRCLESVIGWKIPWLGDPTNKAMLATRLLVIKNFPTA